MPTSSKLTFDFLKYQLPLRWLTDSNLLILCPCCCHNVDYCSWTFTFKCLFPKMHMHFFLFAPAFHLLPRLLCENNSCSTVLFCFFKCFSCGSLLWGVFPSHFFFQNRNSPMRHSDSNNSNSKLKATSVAPVTETSVLDFVSLQASTERNGANFYTRKTRSTQTLRRSGKKLKQKLKECLAITREFVMNPFT